MKVLNYRMLAESWILIGICLADMLLTLYWVSMGFATEQNPVMAGSLHSGPWLFVLIKLISFIPFVAAIEWYRKKNPDFCRKACRAAIGLYVGAYIALTLGVNLTGA